jgi:hypothetical protein
MSIYFVSGHLDISKEEFTQHYSDKLLSALKTDASFVVGDASGVDTLAQAFLSLYTQEVTVYHMFDKPRNNSSGFKTIGGFKKDKERDEQMTLDSNKDIAWYRSVDEQKALYQGKYRKRTSGTEKNVKRRAKWDRLPPDFPLTLSP